MPDVSLCLKLCDMINSERVMTMRMLALFIGHGSPMNAIEVNNYTNEWKRIGALYQPKAILIISAHWYERHLYIQSDKTPQKINDMYGFPNQLYDLVYNVQGNEELTESVRSKLGERVSVNDRWGIDHGAWSVLVHMYPKADVPVVQLSINESLSPQEQFKVGEQLKSLREEGYMIIASGNIVHNLSRMRFGMDQPYPWAQTFDDYIEKQITSFQFEGCISYQDLSGVASLSVPTPDHYYPLLVLLGCVTENDNVTVFNKGFDLGSVSMTSYLFD